MSAARKIKADDVCAYTWRHASEQARGSLCALAGLADSFGLLEWYELGHDQRAALRAEIADLIEANASRQRAEWATTDRAA